MLSYENYLLFKKKSFNMTLNFKIIHSACLHALSGLLAEFKVELETVFRNYSFLLTIINFD